MYNKLFARILDSSIWLEPSPTRIVWLMFIAAMDEAGMVHFASVANVAVRAIIALPDAEQAVRTLEAPDPNSADADHDGRRIERVQGGWLVLNADKYRGLVTREMVREQTRKRVARYRSRRRNVTHELRNANGEVTTSDTDTDTEYKDTKGTGAKAPESVKNGAVSAEAIYAAYPKRVAKPKALLAIRGAMRDSKLSPEELLKKTVDYAWVVREMDPQFIPYPTTWFNQHRFNDAPETWRRHNGSNNGNGTNQRHNPESSRSIGTSNEGKSSQYAGVGKVRAISNAG